MPDFKFSERSAMIAAFAAIYVIWGSTYLAIRFLAETLPGLSMVGVRFFIAGVILYAWARWRRAPRPTPKQWRSALVTGVLMLCGGTGGVVVAIRYVDSGLVALLVGMVPLWIALLMWFWPGAKAPSGGAVGALLIGFLGVFILAAPSDVFGGAPVHLPSVLITMMACIFWGIGSLYSRDVELPKSPRMASAVQMLGGGAALVVWGVLDGEWHGFELQAVSWSSVLAFFYLIGFGSLVAFSAYSWLIRTAEPTLVSTYAYVNPVVAVFLGWLLADEPIGPRTLVAAALIIGSVVLVTTANARRKARTVSPVDEAEMPRIGGRGDAVAADASVGRPLAKKCA